MESRFEQQQPLSHSSFFHSDTQPQHVGRRLTDEEAQEEQPAEPAVDPREEGESSKP